MDDGLYDRIVWQSKVMALVHQNELHFLMNEQSALLIVVLLFDTQCMSSFYQMLRRYGRSSIGSCKQVIKLPGMIQQCRHQSRATFSI